MRTTKQLLQFINGKKPHGLGQYWWPCGEIEPRIEWIKQQLEA
jgi:hypothetical protein